MIFKNKTVIITGGSRGVGAATARKFADAGANLVLIARGKKNLEAIAEELRGRTRVEILAMDVSDPDACADLLKKAAYEFGGVDILVNNAGNHTRGPFESVSIEDLGYMIDVNLKAPVVLCRIALPFLRESTGAAIINVASLAGRTPVPGSATYSAAKFGLRIFTLALAEELRGSRIKLAIVSPGPVNTGFIMSDIDQVSDLTFSQPISTDDEVAQAILDLCGNNQREQTMPAFSGYLTTLAYLFPWLGRLIKPLLQRKGQRVKQRLKRAAKAADKASSEPQGKLP
jgi:short-subunit dehydrogenase